MSLPSPSLTNAIYLLIYICLPFLYITPNIHRHTHIHIRVCGTCRMLVRAYLCVSVMFTHIRVNVYVNACLCLSPTEKGMRSEVNICHRCSRRSAKPVRDKVQDTVLLTLIYMLICSLGATSGQHSDLVQFVDAHHSLTEGVDTWAKGEAFREDFKPYGALHIVSRVRCFGCVFVYLSFYYYCYDWKMHVFLCMHISGVPHVYMFVYIFSC